MAAVSNERAKIWRWSALVGVAAAVISLWRLWLGNDAALTENLWAEDGLFPLCIHKADFWACLGDPFAGYLLFLPRVLAWPTSILPLEWWALSANLLSALLAGLVSAFALMIMRRAGLGWFVSVAVALLPVLAPTVGLEAINALGSSYMLLLYLSTLAVLFPPTYGWGRWGMIVAAALLLVSALTIPSAIVLVALVIVQWSRTALRPAVAAWWLSGLVVGLAAQALVAFSAPTRRPVSLNSESLNAWADSIPVSVFTYWPGLSIAEYSFFTNFSLAPLSLTGWLFVAVLVAVGTWQVVVGWGMTSGYRAAVGMLVLAGLAFGLIPSAIGYANNRYFVVPLLLWAAAALVAAHRLICRTRPRVLVVATAAVLVIWWPAVPASDFRSTPAPDWTDEVARIKAKCLADPAFVDRPIFTPFWPPNWGDGLDEPTHPNLPCTVTLTWLG